MSDQASTIDYQKFRPIFYDVIRGLVLTFEAEHGGKTITVRYRPSVALTSPERFERYGPVLTPESVPVFLLLKWYVDLLVELAIDGQPAPVEKATMTSPTVALLAALTERIMAHAAEWQHAEIEARGQYFQMAMRKYEARRRR